MDERRAWDRAGGWISALLPIGSDTNVQARPFKVGADSGWTGRVPALLLVAGGVRGMIRRRTRAVTG